MYKVIEGYEYFIFGYESDNPSNYFFKDYILERPTSNEEHKKQTIYTNNLLYAKKYFEGKLKEFSKNELKILFKKVTSQLKFNTYEVDSNIEVFVIFENP